MSIKTMRKFMVLAMLPVSLTLGQEQTAAPQSQPAADQKPISPQALTVGDMLTYAQRYFDEGRTTDAQAILDRVLARESANVDALRLSAEIAMALQDAERARQIWRHLRQISETDFYANYGLGKLYLQRGVGRQAKGYLDIAARVAPPDRKADVLLALAQACLGAGLPADARTHVKAALAADPTNFEAWTVQVLMRLQYATTAEEYDQALADVERAKQLASDELRESGTTLKNVQRLFTAYDLEARVLREYMAVFFERNPDGRTSDRLLPGRGPRAADIVSRTVDVMIRQSELQKTLNYYEILNFARSAVELSGGRSTRALNDFGSLLLATGQNDAAITAFQKVLEIEPGNTEALRQLSALGVQPGQTPPAQ